MNHFVVDCSPFFPLRQIPKLADVKAHKVLNCNTLFACRLLFTFCECLPIMTMIMIIMRVHMVCWDPPETPKPPPCLHIISCLISGIWLIKALCTGVFTSFKCFYQTHEMHQIDTSRHISIKPTLQICK